MSGTPPSQERPPFNAEQFFASQPAPLDLAKYLDDVRILVETNLRSGMRVVLVTSGGTTVPLEHNTVRFLDNFSAGTRGSVSAEHFLRTGLYAVIFLHRQHSLQPFSRHYGQSTISFLDLLEVVDGQSETIKVAPPHLGRLLSVVRSYQHVKNTGLLHCIPFTTIDEYFFLLPGVSRVMGTTMDGEGNALGRRGMYYLAAAVSDFFIPRERMLETDPALLVPKSRLALERYGHQVVVGNTLAERKSQVVFVENGQESWVRVGESGQDETGARGEEREIEQDIVLRLVRMHDAWIG
ncbi:hypothetical protein RQP46_007867 [Phenoliferia psychrophenolica]